MPSSKLTSEQQLEAMIVREPRILSREWMLIGQQEITAHGGRIDLLVTAQDGSLVLIELKVRPHALRDRRPSARLCVLGSRAEGRPHPTWDDARVWVEVPKTGYVGVGEMTVGVQRASEFTVPTEAGDQLAMDVVRHGEQYRATADDTDRSEYFVRVKWLDTVDSDQAFNEVGMFGNQNTVCQPTTPKWRHTVERLQGMFTGWARSLTKS